MGDNSECSVISNGNINTDSEKVKCKCKVDDHKKSSCKACDTHNGKSRQMRPAVEEKACGMTSHGYYDISNTACILFAVVFSSV